MFFHSTVSELDLCRTDVRREKEIPFFPALHVLDSFFFFLFDLSDWLSVPPSLSPLACPPLRLSGYRVMIQALLWSQQSDTEQAQERGWGGFGGGGGGWKERERAEGGGGWESERIMGVFVARSVQLRACGALAPLPVLCFTCCSHSPCSVCSLHVCPPLFSFIFSLLTPTERFTVPFLTPCPSLFSLNLPSFYVDIWYCEWFY